MLTNLIETLAAIFGILGALLLAIPGVHPAFGFAVFLLSNIGWVIFSRGHKHWRLLAQHLCFLLTTLFGLWNWWLGPLLIGGQP